YWLDVDAAWKKAQHADGGWSQAIQEGDSTFAMTCAGVATLFTLQDYVLRTNLHQFDVCKGGITNPNVDKGLAWLDAHAGSLLNGKSDFSAFNLYLLERVGTASGRRYVGAIDWYKRGADAIVHTQQANGSWNVIHETAFAMLFLAGGRRPVIM